MRETDKADCWLPEYPDWNHSWRPLGQNCGLCWFGRRRVLCLAESLAIHIFPSLTASMSVQNAMESSVTQEILPGFQKQILPLFSRPELDMTSLSVSGHNRSLLSVTAEVDSKECLVSYVTVLAPSVQETGLVQDVQQSIRVTANESVGREAATGTDEHTDGPFGCQFQRSDE